MLEDKGVFRHILFVKCFIKGYRIEGNVVRITDIYNEREKFMRRLFSIKTITQETEDYWGNGVVVFWFSSEGRKAYKQGDRKTI